MKKIPKNKLKRVRLKNKKKIPKNKFKKFHLKNKFKKSIKKISINTFKSIYPRKKHIPSIYNVTNNDVYLNKSKIYQQSIITSSDTEITLKTGYPMGYTDKNDSVINFDYINRTFTISPLYSSYEVWVTGTKFIVDISKSITIPNVSGIYYIAYQKDLSGNLELIYKNSYYDLSKQAQTVYIYYNSSFPGKYMFFDDRRGMSMDWSTRNYLHMAVGTRINYGFIATNYTIDSDGSSDTHAQFGFKSFDNDTLSIGSFFNGDLQINVYDISGMGTQKLVPIAYLPIVYLKEYTFVENSNNNGFSFYTSSGIPNYNNIVSNYGTLSPVTSGHYFTQWIVATSQKVFKIISIMGQKEYSSINLVPDTDTEWQVNMANSVTLSGLPEFSKFISNLRPCYRIIYKYSESYTNNVHTIIARIDDARFMNNIIYGYNNDV